MTQSNSLARGRLSEVSAGLPAHVAHRWQASGLLIAAGAFILGTGLLLGPGPGSDPAEALENIDGFRVRYVVTNAIDLVGVLVLGVGLLVLGRVQGASALGGTVGVVGGALSLAGAVLIGLTVILQSAVDPEVAQRYVEASGTAREIELAIGTTIFGLDGAIFGLGFLLMMGGIALAGFAGLIGAGPALNPVFLAAGTILATIASGSALLVPFGAPDDYAVIEAVLGLIVLVWLVALGAMLALHWADEA